MAFGFCHLPQEKPSIHPSPPTILTALDLGPPDNKGFLGVFCWPFPQRLSCLATAYVEELQLKPPNVLNKSVDNITAFQVNPEPSVSKGWLLGRRAGGRLCCWGRGRQITFVHCKACSGFAGLPRCSADWRVFQQGRLPGG